MAELASLRAANQALNEGLITQQDFEAVKVAFLRAQQIRAGLDAGFIRQTDYDKAVNAYLHAMEFQLVSCVPSLTAPAPASARQAAAGLLSAAAQAPASPQYQQKTVSRPSVAGVGGSAQLLPARNSSSGGIPLLYRGANGAADAAAAFTPSLSAHTTVSDDGEAERFAAPADLPDYCKGATAGKKSMSGIAIDGTCINLFMHMKTRSAYKWLTFKVDDSGRTVVPDKIGGPSSSYNDFVCALPDDQCRYGVYDYEYRSNERGTFKKLVFLLWAPDNSGIKPKMMYASTKDFFKGFLDGIGAELQANEPAELSEDEIKDRVVSNMTRK